MAENHETIDPNAPPRLRKPRPGDPLQRLEDLTDRVETLERRGGKKNEPTAEGTSDAGNGSTARSRKKR